jgi:hypothetical protein
LEAWSKSFSEEMNINRNNYEAYLLDLVEGRLNSEDTRRVRDFLLMNPDCAGGLEKEQLWFLEPETVSYHGKEQLRKEVPNPASVLSDSNFDLFSIARLEGDLTHEQEKDHRHMVERDGEKLQKWLAWEQTKLVGETIHFMGKDQLKKNRKPNTRLIWISAVSSAAAIALLLMLIRVVPVAVDPEIAAEPVVHQTTTAISEEVPVSSSANPESLILADEPVILSIRKHQDPPELTGKDQGVGVDQVKIDSTRHEVIEEYVQTRPVKMALMEKYTMQVPEMGHYDRIVPLDLPPGYAQSYSVTWAQLSEEGLKQTYQDFIREKDLSLLTIASAGVDGINRLTGSDLSLNLSRGKEGEVSGFRFRSNRLSIAAPVEKTE